MSSSKKSNQDLKNSQLKISRDLPIAKILSLKPASAKILTAAGISCLGCPWSALETLEQGAKAHGWSQQKLEKIIKQINAS